MFEGQPKGLWALALANTGERFGYYTMIAVFALFLRANFGLSAGVAGTITVHSSCSFTSSHLSAVCWQISSALERWSPQASS